jgi:hypothetical protein
MQVPGLAHAQSAPNADPKGRLRGFEGEVVNSDGAAGDVGVLTIRDPRTGDRRVIHLTFEDAARAAARPAGQAADKALKREER